MQKGELNYHALQVHDYGLSRMSTDTTYLKEFSKGSESDFEYNIKMFVNAEHNETLFCTNSRSQWPRGLRRLSAAARLLRLWVRIPQGAWTSVCCECRVLSSRGLCDGLITRPEDSYRLCCVVVCDLETS